MGCKTNSALTRRNRAARAEGRACPHRDEFSVAPCSAGKMTRHVGTIRMTASGALMSATPPMGGNAMKLPRRQFLHLAAGAAALPALPRMTWAQAYPSRPVRWVVPFPPGGPAEILARLFGQFMSERLGQPFVIENRPGAGGNIGTEAVVRSPPDGYTMLLVTTANTINASLYVRLSYNFIRDIAPVAALIRVPAVLEINPMVPVDSVPAFVAYAKANPGRLNMASAGTGTIQHVAGEMFKMMTGASLQHVPYRGQAPALTDLIGGQVQVMFDSMPASIEHIRAGKVRALAVTTTV